jgi:ABC-type transporter Mla subunit MlaD
MNEMNKLGREVEETAKETWRKADGEEDLADKIGNAGDDLRKHAGNLGDDLKDAADDASDAVDDRR